jgi:hypothetical protein
MTRYEGSLADVVGFAVALTRFATNSLSAANRIV